MKFDFKWPATKQLHAINLFPYFEICTMYLSYSGKSLKHIKLIIRRKGDRLSNDYFTTTNSM